MKPVIFKAKRMKLNFKPGPLLLGILELERLLEPLWKKKRDKAMKEGLERIEKLYKGDE